MKGLKPFPLIGFAILLCVLMSGCDAHAPQSGPGALDVSQFVLAQGAIGVPYEQVLLASGGQAPYTWTLTSGTLPPGLSLQANGIVSGTPTLVGGVTYPNTYNFSVKVTDSQTPTAAYNTLATSIVINPVLTFPPATLQPGTIGQSYSATVTASGGVSPYSYTIVFGSLPDGLTLTGSGTGAGNIMGTPTTAGTFNFTVQATDTVSETATEAFTIVITGRLQGSYVISLNGFASGAPFYMAGSFVADGNGNITSGVFDQTGPTSVTTNSPITAGSTYTLPANSNLGTMTLNTALGTFVYDIVVSTTQTRIILANADQYGSGLITPQSPPTLPSNGAGYSFGAVGTDSAGNRYAGAGAFAINASLAVTGGEEDTNDNGTLATKIPITGGNLAVTPLDSSTGRGTASLTTASGTSNYAYYVISNTELAAVEIDSGGPYTLLSIMQQGASGTIGGTSFTNASLKGQSVMQLNAVNPNGGSPLPDVSVGVASFDGNGNISRTDGLPGFYTDENNGGTILQNSFGTATSPATYNVDPTCATLTSACGRVTVAGIGTDNPVWYLVNTNQAFVVGTDPNVTAGSFSQQSGAPFTIGAFLGSYLGGTTDPVLASVTNEVDVALTPPPGGILSLKYETSGPGGPQGAASLTAYYDCSGMAGTTTCSAEGAAWGRFEITTTATAPSPQISIVYVLGAGNSGITGGKTGLVGLNVGTTTGTTEPNPRITNYAR